jgi:hypothetical protein
MPTQPALKEYEFNDTDSEEEDIQDQDSTTESIHQDEEIETPESIQDELLMDNTPSEESYVPYMTPEPTPEPSKRAEQFENSEATQNIAAVNPDEWKPRDINAILTTDHIIQGPRKSEIRTTSTKHALHEWKKRTYSMP